METLLVDRSKTKSIALQKEKNTNLGNTIFKIIVKTRFSKK